MEQINKYRSPIVLGVLVLFLLLFAFFMLGLQPDSKQISENRSEISLLEKQNEMLQNKVDELKSSNALDPEKDALLAALPIGDGSEQLILDLREVEAKTYARIKDITFTLDDTNPIQQMTGSPDIQYPTVKQIKMTAVVEGGYTEIYNWMSMIQLLPRIINIDSFNFQQPHEQRTAQSPGSILTANISFSAYYEDKAAAQ